MEDNFKPEPSEKEIQVAENLYPEIESYVYREPEKVAEIFLNNPLFRELLLSRIPKEELVKAEKLAKEQNTTTDEIIKKKLVEILKDENSRNE